MKTRMWISETDRYGGANTDRQFYIDDPVIVPRYGEFVEHDDASGWVSHVQHSYSSNQLIIRVILDENRWK